MATTKTTPHDCPLKDFVIPPQIDNLEVSHKMDTRVGRLEGVVETLTHDIQEVSHSVSLVGTQIGELKDMFTDTISKLRDTFSSQLETVTSRLTQSTKPAWQTITAFVSITIVMLGMAGAVVSLILSGQAENIKQVQINTNSISDRLFTSQYEKGKNDALSSQLVKSIIDLDTKLQKETSLTVSVTDAKLSGLDTKIQLEMELIRKKTDADVENSKIDIANIKEWRLRHAEEDAATGAETETKVEVLEKKIEELDKRQWEYRTERLNIFEDKAWNGKVKEK